MEKVIICSPASALYSCSLSSQPAIYYMWVLACIHMLCFWTQTHSQHSAAGVRHTQLQAVLELVFRKRWQRAACQEHSIIGRRNAWMALLQANTCHSCEPLFVYVLKVDKDNEGPLCSSHNWHLGHETSIRIIVRTEGPLRSRWILLPPPESLWHFAVGLFGITPPLPWTREFVFE